MEHKSHRETGVARGVRAANYVTRFQQLSIVLKPDSGHGRTSRKTEQGTALSKNIHSPHNSCSALGRLRPTTTLFHVRYSALGEDLRPSGPTDWTCRKWVTPTATTPSQRTTATASTADRIHRSFWIVRSAFPWATTNE